MKNIGVLVIMVLFGHISSAQTIQINSLNDLAMLNNVNERKSIISNGEIVINTKDLDGTPYWNENFAMGKIISTKDNSSIVAFIRYRIFDDIFEIKKEKNDADILIMKRSKDYNVLLNNEEFTFLKNLPIEINGAYNGYAMILVTAKNGEGATLYKRFSKEYHPEVKPKGSYDRGKKASLESANFYFIKVHDQLHLIEPDRKEAYKAFPDHNEQLKDYIKDEKLRFRKDEIESDLIKLITYYNTLP